MAGRPSNPSAAAVAPHSGVIGLIHGLSTLCGWFAAAMIMLSVLVTCQMIFVRYFMNQSTVWQTEAVTYMMIAATMVGLPYVQKLRGHVNVDLVPMMLSKRARKWLAFAALSLTIGMIAMMAVYGFEFWHYSWKTNLKSDSVWPVRMWIPHLTVPVGFGLLLLQLLADMWLLLTGRDKPFNIDKDENF
jgi:TRAP-type C4-dicarboxylate transport system permease small subunit